MRTDSEDCLFLNVYTPRSVCSPKNLDESCSHKGDELWNSESSSKETESHYNEDAEMSKKSSSWNEIEPSASKSNNNVKKRELLPVIVFIHGGAFRSGNLISYHPTYIMDLPLIFVQITYRLGVLGKAYIYSYRGKLCHRITDRKSSSLYSRLSEHTG